MNILFELIFF